MGTLLLPDGASPEGANSNLVRISTMDGSVFPWGTLNANTIIDTGNVNSGNSGSDFAGSGYTVMGYNPWR
jgi:hypothetical protein